MAKRPRPPALLDKDYELLRRVLWATGWKHIANQDNRLVVSKDGGKTTYHWNPLHDPGDAMELAVMFGLRQDHHHRWSCARGGRVLTSSCCVPHAGVTPMQAACRAITQCVEHLALVEKTVIGYATQDKNTL